MQSNGGSKLEEGLESFAEKLIGLKDDQLRDLMELELPVPQEDKATGKVVEGEDTGSKVFRLPELRDFLQDTSSKDVKQEQPADLFVPLNSPKVNRRNFDEYQEFLRKNPYADSDERYFTEEVRIALEHNLLLYSLINFFASMFSLISFHLYLVVGSYLVLGYRTCKQDI